MKTFTLLDKEFPKSAAIKARVELLWGGTDLDKTNVPAWNTSYKGDVIFDN